jgi:RNA polymerase sigma factor (TIGR02999 family)
MAEFRPYLVTGILNTLKQGDQSPSAELLPILYNELRNLARSLIAQYPPGQTLQPTALVHEAYLHLSKDLDSGWNSRGHFFGAAAQAMRRILVDQARLKATIKRGGDQQRVELNEEALPFDVGLVDILALDRALDDLKSVDERKVNVVLLRFLTGLSIPETAQALEISETTVERDWRFARAFLYQRMTALDDIFGEGNGGL